MKPHTARGLTRLLVPDNSDNTKWKTIINLAEMEGKKQIWLKVLSLSGVLDAQKTHTISDNNKIMVAGSCELGIGGNWGCECMLGEKGIC